MMSASYCPIRSVTTQDPLEIKTVTDKTASQAIAQFGLERKLDNWVRPKDIYRELKQLTGNVIRSLRKGQW